MTNRIQEFLNRYEESTVRDVATHGVQSGAIGSLIYTSDVVDFFNRYYSEIEAVVTEYLEGITGMQYYDLLNYELMSDLQNYANVEFQSEDSYIELQFEMAEDMARNDIADFEEMDEDEQQEAIFECLEFVELEVQDVDKVDFVHLAVEIVAQQMQEA